MEAVPGAVREQFDTVLNLVLYSWFVYEFSSSALMLANATVEKALVRRYEKENGVRPKRGWGLRKLLAEAVESGWIVDGDFSHPDGSRFDPEGNEYCKTLSHAVPDLRNSLAHGSGFLSSPMQIVGMIEINARLINALFKQVPN